MLKLRAVGVVFAAALAASAPAIVAVGEGSQAAGAVANGQTITFDEFAPLDGGALAPNTYAAQGVTVATDDGSTWGGNSNGDPGNWSLEGTNGPQFLGFNGASYAATFTLDEPVATVSLDVSRSEGSSDGTVTIQAFLGAVPGNSNNVVLGAINTWSTLSVTGPLDSFTITGTGSGFHPFGIDNVVIGAAAPNQPPVANAGTDQTVTLSGGTVAVVLDGSLSSDPDGDPLTYAWTGGFSGGTATGVGPMVTFAAPGVYVVQLQVNDGTVDSVPSSLQITVLQAVVVTPNFTG